MDVKLCIDVIIIKEAYVGLAIEIAVFNVWHII